MSGAKSHEPRKVLVIKTKKIEEQNKQAPTPHQNR